MNQKFGLSLHVLTYLDLECADKLCTSNEIAESIQTNPVVVRRLLPQLKKAGFVVTKRGHGGIKLNKDANLITLYDVYEVCVDEILNIRTYDENACPIASHMHDAIYETLDETSRLFKQSLQKKTIRDISNNIEKNMKKEN